jgi:iron complex outermembrane receptor protein
MANHSPLFKATRISAAVAICLASNAWAQQNPTEITITDKLPARVSGFGDVPAQELPFSTTTIGSAALQDIGARRVSNALHLDASVTDSYNSPAYWDVLSVRGFTLDNRYNYRREGLPISAETMIPLDNKERIELLKGTSGIQAGTSSPGGLVNYVVKRAPTQAEQKIRNVTLSYGEGNNRLVSADLGGRFGNAAEFGYRFNVAHEDLNPYIKDTTGHRDLVALAMDWRLKPGTVIDFEFEQSHRQQIGVNANSLVGGTLPPLEPRFNLTRQPWSQPGVFDARTGTLRLRHNLESGWLWTTQYGVQRLRADDRLAYATGANGGVIFNMFSSAGNFDLYDWRSENERRSSDSLSTEISGSSVIGGYTHDLAFSVMRQRMLTRMPYAQLFDYAGSGNVFTHVVDTSQASSSGPLSGTTDLSEYANEFAIKDRVHLSAASSVWLGLRQTQINRSSINSDGDAATRDERNLTTPWMAVSHAINPSVTAYASYGQGVEASVTPNKPNQYANAGQAIPALKSRQHELGLKGQSQQASWQVTWFDITRPATGDLSTGLLLTRQIDGEAHHRGLELSGNTRVQNWNLGSGITWIDAKRQNATIDPAVNGQRPINVPTYILRGMAEYRYSSVPGLRTGVRLSHEGERNVTETGDVKLPAWTTIDASAHYDTKVNNVTSTWTLAVNNLANKQYWRESPMQYGHYYLYPGAPRTVRATVQFRL